MRLLVKSLRGPVHVNLDPLPVPLHNLPAPLNDPRPKLPTPLSDPRPEGLAWSLHDGHLLSYPRNSSPLAWPDRGKGPSLGRRGEVTATWLRDDMSGKLDASCSSTAASRLSSGLRLLEFERSRDGIHHVDDRNARPCPLGAPRMESPDQLFVQALEAAALCIALQAGR